MNGFEPIGGRPPWHVCFTPLREGNSNPKKQYDQPVSSEELKANAWRAYDE
jgi:hypothetical protein